MSTRKLKKHLKYLIPQIRLALIREPGPKPLSILCPQDLDKFIEPLKHYTEEYFVSFHLSAKSQVTSYHIVSHGTISASLVSPREVYKAAILANSHSILVAHNHPGCSLNPSDEDIRTTRQLIEAGELMGVPLVDHVIVSSDGTLSMRETLSYLWP